MAKVHGYIGEIPGGVLEKVQWTFANWRNSRGCVGESTMDFLQLSRNNINIGYVSKLKLMLLEHIYISQPTLINVVDKNLFSRRLIHSQIGENTVDFRQLVKFQEVYWRKYSGRSPLAKVLLAKFPYPEKTLKYEYEYNEKKPK
jgi:hypothetical protein